MRRFAVPFTIAIMFVVTAINGGAQAADGRLSPLGMWSTPDGGAHIQIADCGGTLCGTIAWLKHPRRKNGTESIDSNNPNPDLRSRKILGLQLLSGFKPDESDSALWTNGRIYDPDSGKTYSCNLTLEDAATMRVRGYIGISIFGRTQIWRRVAQ